MGVVYLGVRDIPPGVVREGGTLYPVLEGDPPSPRDVTVLATPLCNEGVGEGL